MNSELNSRDPAKQAGACTAKVEIAGKHYPAIPLIKTLCVPEMKKVKA